MPGRQCSPPQYGGNTRETALSIDAPPSSSTLSRLRGSASAATSTGPAGDEPARTLSPRRNLPGSRAVVGGLLVVLAAIVAWWAATAPGRDRPTSYVVAVRTIGPGDVLTAEDLRTAPMDLGPASRARAFTDREPLVGSIALGPIAAGELVQAGAVTDDAGGTAKELSFSVAPEWAVGGALRPGDRIDVLATYGQGATSETLTVLDDVTVRRIDDLGGDAITDGRTQTVTVGLEDGDDAAEVVNAARAATLTVVRVTGAGPPRAGRSHYRAAAVLGEGGATAPEADATGSAGGSEAGPGTTADPGR